MSDHKCLSWNGSIRRGHPVKKIGYREYRIRRIHYTVFVGPIPRGHVVYPVCGNPLCVEPTHLATAPKWPGKRHGGGPRVGTRNGRAVLNERHVVALRRRAEAGANSTALSRSFGVSRAAALKAARRQTWRHVE